MSGEILRDAYMEVNDSAANSNRKSCDLPCHAPFVDSIQDVVEPGADSVGRFEGEEG